MYMRALVMVGEGRDAWRRVYYVAVCGVQKVGEKFWCFLGGVGKVCGWYNFICWLAELRI